MERTELLIYLLIIAFIAYLIIRFRETGKRD